MTMKKLFTFSAALLAAAMLYAQEVTPDSAAAPVPQQDTTQVAAQEETPKKSAKKFPPRMEYDRSSLAMCMIYHSEDEFGAAIDSAYHAMPFPDKYDDHNIGLERIDNSHFTGVQRGNKVGLIKAQYGKKLNAKDLQKNAEAIENLINEHHVANYMLAKWFGLYESDTCNLDLVFYRGQYNATELDLAIAGQTQSGMDRLMDTGMELIGNSYLLVNDMTYATAEERAQAAKVALSVIGGLFDAVMGTDLGRSVAQVGGAIADGFTGFAVKNHSYLFRLNWNEELRTIIETEYWMTEPDPAKLDKFLKDERFTMKYVAHEFECSEKTVAKGKKVDREKLIKMVCTRSIDKNIAALQLQYEDFKVKTPVYEEVFNAKGKSLGYAVKIGLKEGISDNSTFQVVRKEEDPETHKVKYRYIATLKPVKGKIWDNRFMAAEDDDNKDKDAAALTYTLMKKTSGGQVLPGMLVIEGKYSKVTQ